MGQQQSFLPGRFESARVWLRGPLRSKDLEGVAAHLRDCSNVIVMVGAGISTSAGIPDFRTPGTGLYDNLERYRLPWPEAVFSLQFFRDNPEPFYTLCKELWPGQYRPTPAHYFMSFLHSKGKLRRCFSQNIDSLECQAKLPADFVVAAHGNFDSATCLDTRAKVPIEEVRAAIMAGTAACDALNQQHGGLVKPDIVMFGEQLPTRFWGAAETDFPQCDLLIVMGTGLQVQPFAGLIDRVPSTVPRLLINRERVGVSGDYWTGFQFDRRHKRDVFLGGDCDDGVHELIRLLGWEEDFASWCKACT